MKNDAELMYLWIKTNKYSGNFERELIGYVMGMEHPESERYAQPYMELFEQCTPFDNYELRDCLKYSAMENGSSPFYSFFNIDSFPDNKSFDCDSVYVQLTKLPSKEIQKEIIDRVLNFPTIYEALQLYGDTKVDIEKIELRDVNQKLLHSFYDKNNNKNDEHLLEQE